MLEIKFKFNVSEVKIANHEIVGIVLFETRYSQSKSVEVHLLTLMRLVGFDEK